jgi:putative transposase
LTLSGRISAFKEVLMAWQESDRVDQRLRFVFDHNSRTLTMSDLCHRYGISRTTGYKWLDRYRQGGRDGLEDRAPIAETCPHATDGEIVKELIRAKKRYRWGAKKLVRVLAEKYPDVPWPAPSTAGDILDRHGLVRKRRRRTRPEHPGRPTTTPDRPNALWTADFKGQFRTGDGIYCYPLTVVDSYSRFILGCRGLDGTLHDPTKAAFRRLFKEFGLPDAIRTDNGVPFSSEALGRLSRLSVWWIKLGIRPELTEPGSPHQNGAHERMHLTLKLETAMPPAPKRASQQRRFDVHRYRFNEIRPHEALGQQPPARIYQPSPRQLPDRLPDIEYPGHYEVRRVSRNGGIRWHHKWLNISSVLAEEYIGLEEVDDGVWAIYFAHLFLGQFDERKWRIYAAKPYNRQSKELGKTEKNRKAKL